jgi:hypothetical protein
MIYLIIILAAATRFLPHPENFAPITAIAIFAAAYLPKKQAVAVPLIARFVSDIFLGFASWPIMAAIYLSHAAGILLGLWVRRSNGNAKIMWSRIFSSSLAASAIFYLVTNFALLYPNYSHTVSGIMQSYANALPFFRGTLLGDLFYSTVLFGSYAFATWLVRKRSEYTATAS